MEALQVRVSGRVQGVWFRASTVQEAIRLGVSGWVKNCPDGSVEVFMQGSGDAVNKLHQWCRNGPPGARVTDVSSQKADPDPVISNFSIYY